MNISVDDCFEVNLWQMERLLCGIVCGGASGGRFHEGYKVHRTRRTFSNGECCGVVGWFLCKTMLGFWLKEKYRTERGGGNMLKTNSIIYPKKGKERW